MQNKKSILTKSLVAGAIVAASSFSANANSLFSFSNLGSSDVVRTNLLNGTNSSKTLDLKCGAKGKTDSTMAKKGKDGKCGEGKCGDKKKVDTTAKKGKDGKCGASKKGM